ncbi:MAG: amidohydrolase, partial [Blautia sp.]|nr:amidohydrolase [Blautia sp.]
CDECYDPMYDFLEKNNIPVLLHSNDPVEFWDKERIPKWAIGAGYYCDETYPTHEQIREETIGILKKHPKLNMTIAHIFFLSNADQYDLAEELLETYPNLTFDLCPGWEMYEGFERDERWRGFIEKYAGRLVYGTDIFGAGWEGRIECLRSSLETDAVYMNADGYRCKGLNLSDEALKKIYRDTYRSVIQPGNPKTIDDKAVKEEYLPIALEWTKRMYPNPAEQEKIKEKLLALVEK